jgi:hypothetical protein
VVDQLLTTLLAVVAVVDLEKVNVHQIPTQRLQLQQHLVQL